MQLKNGTFCPLIKKDCVGLQCAWFTRVQGVDTNTGNQVDEFQCAIAWMPMLLIENSGQQRQTGAAVESFRNEMVKANETSQKVLMESLSVQQPSLVSNNARSTSRAIGPNSHGSESKKCD